MTAVALPEQVEVIQSARMPGGLLSVALPAPAGWQRGLAIPFYGCGEPILRDKCIAGTDVAHRPFPAEFQTFPIEQNSECSTLSGFNHQEAALARLDETTEWALGRQLATDQVGTGSPSFEDADVLGTVAGADFVTAVGCLEQAAVDAGFGKRWVLHSSVRGAAYLRNQKMVNDDFLSPTGAKWAFSPGYPVQGATTVRLWATGPLWVGVDTPEVFGGVDFVRNSDAGWALTAGIIAFDPCINIAIDVTVPVCP